MKTTFLDTVVVGMVPVFLTIADVVPWVTVTAGIVTTFWVLLQIIDKLRNWNKL